jgi:hypothetical protein
VLEQEYCEILSSRPTPRRACLAVRVARASWGSAFSHARAHPEASRSLPLPRTPRPHPCARRSVPWHPATGVPGKARAVPRRKWPGQPYSRSTASPARSLAL